MAHVRTESQNLTFNAAGDAVAANFDLQGIQYAAIFVWWHDGNGHTGLDAAPTVDGAASTLVRAMREQGNVRVIGYEIVNPTEGAAVSVSINPGAGVGNAAFAGVTIFGFDDTVEATPSDNATDGGGTDTTAELTVTSAVGDVPVFFVCARASFAPSGIAPTNYTEREDHINGVGMVGGGEGTGAASVAFVGTLSAGAIIEWVTMGWNINVSASASAAITGTAGDGCAEADIVAGGQTIIITLTGDTFVASGAAFDAIRQDIIDGIAGSGGDTTDQLQNGLAVTDVVRTSDTVVTITASAIGGYSISATATYEVTVPASALTGAAPLTAVPTFDVTADASSSDAVLIKRREDEVVYLRKYNTLLAGGYIIRRRLLKADLSGYATDSDWTPGAGDVQVSEDAGALANIGTLPTYANGFWSFVLSAAELQNRSVAVTINDAILFPDFFIVETFGDPSSMYPTDLSVADVAQTADHTASIAAILEDTGTTLQAEVDGIQADTEDLQTRLPAALVGGRMDSSIGAMAANVLTAAATAADFSTEVVAAIFARAFSASYGSLTFDEAIKVLLSVLVGQTTGAGTASIAFRNLANDADVVAAAMTGANRTGVTLTP